MATISARKRGDGTTGYTAQIRVKKAGQVIHTEAKTFERKAHAVAWAKAREVELQVGGPPKRGGPTLADVIDRYLADVDADIGRTKDQVLRAIKAHPIAAKRCSEITSPDIVSWLQAMHTLPQTRMNYAQHLSAIFTMARPAWGYELDQQVMRDAMAVARRLKIVSKSQQRERRPTADELDRLMEHFGDVRARRPRSIPMQALIGFAIYSTRRQAEMLRITWADLDVEHSRVMVRDMKNPGDTAGNDVWVDLPPEALAIVLAQPRRSARIFPYSTDAVGTAFTRACKALGIEDLREHDLRHHGISRLIEMGGTIPEVAAVSGHRTWQSLQRYSHYKKRGDCMKDWKWLPLITQSAAKPG